MMNNFLFTKKATTKKQKKNIHTKCSYILHTLNTESISQQNVKMVLDDINRLTPYHVIHGWFPVMPLHYIAFCHLRYIPKN